MTTILKKTIGAVALAALMLAVPLSGARAGQSDVDLFAGTGSFPPNIMIMLDSSGSMRNPPSSGGSIDKIDIAKSALNTLITTVNPPDGSGGYTENARFGLFIFQSYGGELVTPITSGNTATIIADVANQGAPGGYGTPIDGAALDVMRYFSGSTETWGTLEKWGRDSTEPAVADPFDYSCRTSHMIYISDGAPSSDRMYHTGYWNTIGDADGDAGAGEGGITENNSNVSDSRHEWGDDITYVGYRRDFRPNGMPGLQNVTTHVIGFDVNLPLLERMAINGGGNYYRTNSAATLATALQGATSSVFDASASYSTAVVPSSRTQFGSAFYNAYFEPDPNDVFWEGHLEAYGIESDGTIIDKDGNDAVDPATNLLYNPPNPHWDAATEMRAQTTTRNVYTYKNSLRIDFDLGNVGNAANQVSETDLNLSIGEVGFYPNAGSSGISTTTQLRDALVGYLHGQDAFNEDNDASWSEPRAKVLGDIFHSTPRIIGAPSTNLMAEPGYRDYYLDFYDRDRIIYVGANDGMLHAINAGTYTVGDDPSTTPEVESAYYTPGTGREVFGYVPGLLLPDIKMVPRNNPRSYYFVDGNPVAADVWLPSSATDVSKEKAEWTTTLITGFREGGEGYFALDITDPTALAAPRGPYPRVMWEFTDPKLGQAWSEPVITRVKINDGNANDNCGLDNGDGDCREHWVAIFAGGYDVSADPNNSNFDSNPASSGWSDRSKALFMVDIKSGNVLARVEFNLLTNPNMIYALPSKPAVLDYDFDGFADVVYVGDLGGQVWKWDIKAVGVDSNFDNEVDNWTAGVWFRTPREFVGSGTYHYRSFFYPPAATIVRGKMRLAFASGEREQLRFSGSSLYAENNRFYVIDDIYPTGASAFSKVYTEADLEDVTNTHTQTDMSKSGYYFEVPDGEKFITDVLIFAGYVVAVSYSPTSASADPCLSATGESLLYVFEVANGGGYWQFSNPSPMPARQYSVGGGLASTPRISMAPDPSNDKIYIKTSKGVVLTLDAPPRSTSGNQVIYWKQNY